MNERIERLRRLVGLLEIEAELAFEMGADDEFELVQRCRDLMASELATLERMAEEELGKAQPVRRPKAD